ncbi:MAG: LPXTG cell wall anchor domain-containing protein [Ruminococcus sp.]|nr:LPXTG cell wall anchor domain-containing protein [Ruminococcus sp.]
MLKKFLIGTLAGLMLSVVPQINATADEGTFCSVKIEDSNVILISDEAAKDGSSTLLLTLKVDNYVDVDTEFYFEHSKDVSFKVLECRYNSESRQLNVYISETQSLFNESNSLNIGTLKAKDKSGNDVDIKVSAEEDALKYVIPVDGNELHTIKTAPAKTNTTLTTTATTSKTKTTTTTTSVTTSSKTKATTTTTSVTTTSKTKATTTTTSVTTTSKTKATTTTTSVTTTSKTKATTTTASVTTTSKPKTTTTTTSATTSSKPETTITTISATTSSKSKTTTTTTSTTTESTITTTEPTTTSSTMTTTVKHIASDEVLCDWSINNYNDQKGIMPDSAEITEKSDGKYQITLTDNSDNVLDVYVINPETGIGTDSSGNEVNLPQTGNNSLKNVLTAVGAFMMTAFGFCAVKLSGITRRKKNEQ